MIETFYDGFKLIETDKGQGWQNKLGKTLPFFFYKAENFHWNTAKFTNKDGTEGLINTEKILINNVDYVDWYVPMWENIRYFLEWKTVSFIKDDGTIIFSKEFDGEIFKIGHHYKGYAYIKYGSDNGVRTVIFNEKGETIIDDVFSALDPVYNHIITVKKAEKFWFYDIKKNAFFLFDYMKYIMHFNSELALYYDKNGTFWYVNKKGEIVLKGLKDAYNFSQNKEYTTCSSEDKVWHIINNKGEIVKTYKDTNSLHISETRPDMINIQSLEGKNSCIEINKVL